jgi:tRNA 2-thiouridine synthesizing protein A
MAEYRTVDARGLKCPMPIVKAKKEIDAIPVGEVLRVVATDPGSVLDFQG